jgi:hypothetical protein
VWRGATGPSGRGFYVAETTAGGLIYFAVQPGGTRGVHACGSAQDLRAKGAFFAGGRDAAGEPWYLGLLVVDGYTDATVDGRRVPIVNNMLAVEEAVPVKTVVITGPAGRKVIRVDQGAMAGP